MPAIRSFFTVSLLAACLAQVMADGHGGQGGQGGGQDQWGGQGGPGQGGPPGGWGGDRGQGKDQYQTTQWQDWQPSHVAPPPAPVCQPTTVTKEIEKPVTVTVTWTKEGEKITVTSIKDGGKQTVTETKVTTVTAAAPCTSVATAVVTQWQNAPPGCWCGGGSPPPAGGQWPWPMGNAPMFTAAIQPGRSSIPAADALKTGVTVASPPPAPTGPPAGPPAGPPGAALTSTGTMIFGPSSVSSSNNAQPNETGAPPNRPVAPPAPISSSSTTAAPSTTSSSSSLSTTTSATLVSPPGPPPAGAAPPRPAGPPPAASTTTSASSTTTSSTSSLATAAALATPAPGLLPIGSGDKPEESLPSAAATAGGFPVGSFKPLDPATLTALAGSHTLGIGR